MITADVRNKPKHFRSQQKQEQMLHTVSPYRKQTGRGVILIGWGVWWCCIYCNHVDWSIMTSHQLCVIVQHENALGAGADSRMFSQSVLEREVIEFCADQVPVGRGAVCHSGVRSLQGFWGPLQNSTGLEEGDLGSMLQRGDSRAARFVALCVHT